MIAVLVATMMLTVPISFASDSDAYTDGSYGAFFTADDGLTNEEYLLLTGADDVNHLLPIMPVLFNGDINYDVVNSVLKIKGLSTGKGYKFEGRAAYTMILNHLDMTFEAEILIKNDCDYIMDDDGIKEDFSDLEAYLGVDGFSAGDKLILKGDYTYYSSLVSTVTYADVSETKCIVIEEDYARDRFTSFDVDVQYLPGGNSDSMKEFTIVDEERGKTGISSKSTFEKEFTQLVVGDSCTNTSNYNRNFDTLKLNVIFDGKDHNKTLDIDTGAPTEPETYELNEDSFDNPATIGLVDDIPDFKELLFEESELSIDQLKTKADEFGSYGETYAALESEASRLASSFMDDDDDNELFLYIGIGVGVVSVIVICGLILFLKRRS